jgi:hypothetical protein
VDGLLARNPNRMERFGACTFPSIIPKPGVVMWEGIVETDLWFRSSLCEFPAHKNDTQANIRPQVPCIPVKPIRNRLIRKTPSAHSRPVSLAHDAVGGFVTPDATKMTSI